MSMDHSGLPEAGQYAQERAREPFPMRVSGRLAFPIPPRTTPPGPPAEVKAGSPVAGSADPDHPWLASELSALAKPECRDCWGLGKKGAGACACVGRTIFWRCFKRYEQCLENDPPGRFQNRTEYVLDFELITARSLSEEERRRFRITGPASGLSGLPWLTAKVGVALRSNGLFPLYKYFGDQDRDDQRRKYGNSRAKDSMPFGMHDLRIGGVA